MDERKQEGELHLLGGSTVYKTGLRSGGIGGIYEQASRK